MPQLFIGIDIGGTNVKIGLFDSGIDLIKKTSLPTEADMGPDFVIEGIVKACKEIITVSDFALDDLAAVGIGTPGPADYPNGIIIQCANMPRFKDVPIRDMIAEGLKAPALLENDANAACWAEFTAGAGKGINDMVFFTLGTGIGGGIVSGGELITGSDYNGAELGHMIIYPDGRECGCGQRGCFEAYASASSTAKRAAEAIHAGTSSTLKKLLDEGREITCKDVFDHAGAGDKLAEDIIDSTAKALAITCVNMLHITEPRRIVFSGGMIAAGDTLLTGIRKHFEKQVWKIKPESVEICFATLGEETGIIGAAALAKHKIQQGRMD